MGDHLGDCLLHLEHHALAGECYQVISSFVAHCLLEHDEDIEQARQSYQREYEMQATAALLSEHRPVEDP